MLTWVVAAIRLQLFELGCVVTNLGPIAAGCGLGQFLTVLGNVRFDLIHGDMCNGRDSTFRPHASTTPIWGQRGCPQMGGDAMALLGAKFGSIELPIHGSTQDQHR